MERIKCTESKCWIKVDHWRCGWNCRETWVLDVGGDLGVAGEGLLLSETKPISESLIPWDRMEKAGDKLCCIPCAWGLSSGLIPVLSDWAHTSSPLSLHLPSKAVRNYYRDWLWLSLAYELYIPVLRWELVSYFAFGGGHGGHGLTARMWKLEASLGLIYSLSFSNRGLLRLEEEGTFPRPQSKPGARLPFLPQSVCSRDWREGGFGEQQVVPFLVLCSYSSAPRVTEEEQKPDQTQFLSRPSFSALGWRNLFFSFFTRGGKTGWSEADWGRNWVKSVWGLIGRPWVSESFWFRWGVSKCFC